jgi:catalase
MVEGAWFNCFVIEKDEADKMPTAFLVDAFAKQLKDKTVNFSIMASIGEAVDSDIARSQ